MQAIDQSRQSAGVSIQISSKAFPTHPAPTEFIHLTNFKSQLASNVYYGVLFGRIRWLYFFLDVHDFRFVCFYFNGIVFLVKVWPLFKREFPRVPMTQRTALARFSNVKSLVSTMRLPWIAWTENAILWNMIIYHETFFDIFSATNLYNNYLIKTPHPTAFHLQQFRGSCHHLWFTVGILWHSQSASCDMNCIVLGKYLIWDLINMYFTTQPFRATGYCCHPSGWAGERAGGCAGGRADKPVSTRTSVIFHRMFSNLAKTFILLRSRTILIIGVLAHNICT